jgi:hypothetical protein
MANIQAATEGEGIKNKTINDFNSWQYLSGTKFHDIAHAASAIMTFSSDKQACLPR